MKAEEMIVNRRKLAEIKAAQEAMTGGARRFSTVTQYGDEDDDFLGEDEAEAPARTLDTDDSALLDAMSR